MSDEYIPISKLQEQNKKKNQLIKSPLANNPNKNPCYKETELIMKCLQENDYNRDVCQPFFDNCETCYKFWRKIKIQRMIKGISPALPPLEERPAIIREHYKQKMQI